MELEQWSDQQQQQDQQQLGFADFRTIINDSQILKLK